MVEALELVSQSQALFPTGEPLQVDKDSLLEKATKRNKSILKLIKEGRVLQKRRASRTTVIRMIGRAWYVRRGSILEGQANLEEAMKLSEDGNPEVTESDHQSDSDHSIKRIVLGRNGYGSFSDTTNFLGGLKMLERGDIRQFASSENMLVVPTPFDFDEVEAGLKIGDLSDEEANLLARYRRNCHNLATKALRTGAKLMDEDIRQKIGLYPEATRSRTGLVGRARPETNVWYRLKEGTYVVPIAVEGGDYMHPPGQFPYKRVNARVIVGKPVPFEMIEKRSEEIPKGQREQFIADYAFSLVVNLMDPKYVQEKQRAYYKQFADL